MTKMTLLEITQDILNDIDADEVNSIDDTVEATQVAQIVKSTYFALVHIRNWYSNRTLVNLVASGDDSLPTHVTLPKNLSELVFINYDSAREGQNRKIFQPIRYVYPDEFLRRQNQYNTENDNVDVIQDPSGVELLIRNDIPPTVYTSFNDDVVVFDAYDKAVDDTIQSHKIQAMGYVTPPWLHEDSFTPSMPEEAFTLLTEEAKSKAAIKLRQVADDKAEQESQRQNRWLSRKQWRVQGGIRKPDYGRKRGK
ncbi:putative tail adaptor protein [Erwinia phage Pecta]|nr:putative tail adaptor protein [Erwinia phage Pecta]